MGNIPARTGALALGAVIASTTVAGLAPAQAVSAARPVASLAFAKAPAGTNPADTARWAVYTGVVTRSMVGHPASILVSSASPIDCASLRTTVAGRTVAPARTTCRAGRLTEVVTVTSPMVGQRIAVTGWLRATTARASVQATVVVGNRAGRTQAQAHRKLVAPLPPTIPTPAPKPTTPTPTMPSPTPAPIGPLVRLGSVGGATVSVASANGQNEVWVGSTRHAGPAGVLWHSSVEGNTVNLWVRGDTSLVHWQLDATGKATTTTIAGTVWRQGLPGFWLAAPSVGGAEPVYHLYDWAGVDHRIANQLMANRGRIGQFTDHEAVIWEGGMLVDQDVVLQPLDGRASYTSEHFNGFVVSSSVDARGVTALLNTGTTVRVEYGRTTATALEGATQTSLSQLGRTTSGSTVSSASTGAGNNVWVGTTHYAAPAGTVVHTAVEGNDVVVWVNQPTVVIRWVLDSTTGTATTTSITGTIKDPANPAYVGTPGFWVDVPGTAGSAPVRQLYTWAGRLVATDSYSMSVRTLQTGFTSQYAVVKIAGMTPPGVEFIPMGTTTEPRIEKLVSGWLMHNQGCDATGCTFTLGSGPGTVRIEPDKDPVYLP